MSFGSALSKLSELRRTSQMCCANTLGLSSTRSGAGHAIVSGADFGRNRGRWERSSIHLEETQDANLQVCEKSSHYVRHMIVANRSDPAERAPASWHHRLQLFLGGVRHYPYYLIRTSKGQDYIIQVKSRHRVSKTRQTCLFPRLPSRTLYRLLKPTVSAPSAHHNRQNGTKTALV